MVRELKGTTDRQTQRKVLFQQVVLLLLQEKKDVSHYRVFISRDMRYFTEASKRILFSFMQR
jgi:hypothetical protein